MRHCAAAANGHDTYTARSASQPADWALVRPDSAASDVHSLYTIARGCTFWYNVKSGDVRWDDPGAATATSRYSAASRLRDSELGSALASIDDEEGDDDDGSTGIEDADDGGARAAAADASGVASASGADADADAVAVRLVRSGVVVRVPNAAAAAMVDAGEATPAALEDTDTQRAE